MSDKPFYFFEEILKALAENLDKSLSLEELTKIVNLEKKNYSDIEEIDEEREKQCIILDNLILLNDIGLVVLNSVTDETLITSKGLKQIYS